MTSNEELEKAISEIEGDISTLNIENYVLQQFVEKKKAELGPVEEDKKKKKKKPQDVLVTWDQKVDIANSVHEEIVNQIANNKKNSEKMIDTLRAVLEETEIRIGELKRDAYEFKRIVVIGAENRRTGKIVAEKVVRYLEDKFKQTDNVIEKLRLKNSALKGQIHKIQTQLSQKEEAGDVLHYIDFHQLQIENKQLLAKIDECNEELLNVKLSGGKAIQVLNEFKRRLAIHTEDSNWLKNEVKSKENLLKKLKDEGTKVEKEMNSEKKAKNKLRLQIEESSEMPDVGDYILQKKEMYHLEAAYQNWQKKVDIIEMAAKRSKSMRK